MKRHDYRLGYTVTQLPLQATGLVKPAPRRGAHRKKRPRRPLPGLLLHQDASRHDWLAAPAAARPGGHARRRHQRDLLGVPGRGRGHGLELPRRWPRWSRRRACSARSTPTAAATISIRPKPAAVSTRQLRPRSAGRSGSSASSISQAYSPEARGRSERAFRTLQDRLPKELALAGITDARGGQPLGWREVYLPEHNARFAVAARTADGTAFVADTRRRHGATCSASRRTASSATTTPSLEVATALQIPPARCDRTSCAPACVCTNIRTARRRLPRPAPARRLPAARRQEPDALAA